MGIGDKFMVIKKKRSGKLLEVMIVDSMFKIFVCQKN